MKTTKVSDRICLQTQAAKRWNLVSTQCWYIFMFAETQNDFLKNKHSNSIHSGFPQRKRKRKPLVFCRTSRTHRLADKSVCQVNDSSWKNKQTLPYKQIHLNVIKMLTTVMWLKRLVFFFHLRPYHWNNFKLSEKHQPLGFCRRDLICRNSGVGFFKCSYFQRCKIKLSFFFFSNFILRIDPI